MYKEISWENQTTVMKNAGESWKRKKSRNQNDSAGWKETKHPKQKGKIKIRMPEKVGENIGLAGVQALSIH